MDFILSYKEFPHTSEPQPVAYLLEVNSPPSQDTATGLKHAEDLHDSVIRDILTLWVFPKVSGVAAKPGGWRLAYDPPADAIEKEADDYILPSKATIINKIRWGIKERKATKEEEMSDQASPKSVRALETPEPTRYVTSKDIKEVSASTLIQEFARSKFPYFKLTDDSAVRNAAEKASNDEARHPVFFENAGGSQVPQFVVDEMCASLHNRNRSINGSKAKKNARDTVSKILGASTDDYAIFLGANASSLLSSLASQYVHLGLIRKEDELILSAENHLANVTPWLEAARTVGAVVKWWSLAESACKTNDKEVTSKRLDDLLTARTRIVAVSHASNILGQIRSLRNIRTLVDSATGGYAHLVVDGVAAAPHWHASVSTNEVDWYVTSCHKLFGPHIGALCGRRQTGVKQLCQAAEIDEVCTDATYRLLEIGTVNYEGCSGLQGLGHYFAELAMFPIEQESAEGTESAQEPFQSPKEESQHSSCQQHSTKPRPLLTDDLVEAAYIRIRVSEAVLTTSLLSWLRNCHKVRIIETPESDIACVARLPVVSFVHETVKPSTIVDTCFNNGFACRHGTFLSNEHLLQGFEVTSQEGVVRFSLAHYNTCGEIEDLKTILETIPGWLAE